MKTPSSILLAAALGLAACTDKSKRTLTEEGSVANARLTLHIVEAAGGG